LADGSEERSREDLTEEASPHRVEEFRQKGRVAQSRELSSLLALIAVAMVLFGYAPTIAGQLLEYMREVFQADAVSHMDLTKGQVIGQIFIRMLRVTAAAALPICGAGFIIGLISSFAQVGSIFSFDPITPSFEKISPLAGIKRLISLRQFYEGLRLLVKMTILLAISYTLIRSAILESPRYLGADSAVLLSAYGSIGKTSFIILICILAVFSGVDFWMQRQEHQKNLRMTKQEAKQEYKEKEGDPQIRARIRAVQREMARKRMMQAVRKADVIVTNPTHIAVALVYDRSQMSAPKVVAKGADFVAQKIKQIAAEAGVPLVENVPLARTLYRNVKVGQFVPKVLYQAVAEVLAYVYRLKRKNL